MRNTILLLAALAALGCGVKAAETKVVIDNDGNLNQATLPDGTTVSSQEEYEAAIAGIVPPIENMDGFAIDVESSQENLNLADGVNVGKFRIQVVPDVSFLAGCIRHSFLHLKIVVTNSKIDMGAMVELHLVAWFESGAPCFAVMNTGFVGYGWCQKVCMKDVKKSIAKTVSGGLVAAGVGATVAKVISALAAPVATAAFAL